MKTTKQTLCTILTAFGYTLLCAVFLSCQVEIREKSPKKKFPQWTAEVTFFDGSKDTLFIESECEPHLTIRDGKSIVRACGYSVYATNVRTVKVIK
jgi:hypothetical protein